MWGLVCGTLALPAAKHRKKHAVAVVPDVPTTCLLAKNFMNAQYTVDLQIGEPPQTLSAVPDTGSFELILASRDCEGCGAHKLFDPMNSTTFQQRGEHVDTRFGQGRVRSEVHYDTVRVGELVADHQSLLLMRVNELRGFDDAAYDAIMGMGMQTWARNNDPDLTLLSTLNVSVSSVCYGQHDDEPGRLQLGSGIPGLLYVELPVIGNLHWALRLEGVAVGSNQQAIAINDCDTYPNCNAIIDSGTSLIAVPSSTLEKVLAAIGEVKQDCSNVDDLPALRLTMGDHELELPPQLYVAKMQDVEQQEDSTESSWGPFKFPFKKSRLVDACVPLFMEMDMNTAMNGPSWILGIPFLRAYAAKFNRAERKIALAAVPLGGDICTSCDSAAGVPTSSHSSQTAFSVLTVSEPARGKSANGIRTLLPNEEISARNRPIKRPVLSMRHISLPTWIGGVAGSPDETTHLRSPGRTMEGGGTRMLML